MAASVIAFALIASAIPPAAVRPSSSLAVYIRDRLHISSYRLARADLNGDRRQEALVYATGREDCGSGGCTLFVLTPGRSNYRVVAKMSVTRLPIQLLPTFSHGWHDISVFVAGGGILPGYDVRLRFDGKSYPHNPTVPPATRLRGTRGIVLIPQ